MNLVVKSLAKLTVYPVRFLPEGHFKESIKARLVRIHNRLPFFLMASPGETLIQVGTPWPNTLLQYSRYLGPRGHVVVVEPEPENLVALYGALDRLPYPNASIVPKGAWSSRGKQSLLLTDRPADHKVEVDGVIHDNDLVHSYDKHLTIEVDTVDNMVRELGLEHVHFIRITVNGAELEVLKGCRETLGLRPLRVWAKGHAREADGEPINQRIMELLTSRGFEAVKTAGQRAVGNDPDWRRRDGDVYAYRL